jgi:serine/threonine-protein kinase
MEIVCTRPGCSRPTNVFPDLDNLNSLKTIGQKYCTNCGMPLILAGRYLPSKLLGKGGFGTAFLARDRYTPTMRACVVKQFQPSANLGPRELEIAQNLFEREAEVLEKLGNKHKQIPDLYAFFPVIVPGNNVAEEEQFFYLVQEFIDGENLEQELARKGQFSEAETLEVLQEMLAVLDFVHNNGSIHRDIKPSNIMRHINGCLYLLDFGAVKQVTSSIGNISNKSTGIYSMGFAPPEQMGGAQVYPSTDLYALAATCVTLLAGKDPKDLYDSYQNKWNWRDSAPQTSQHLADILNRMLLSTPSERFQTAAEVLNQLSSPPAKPVKVSTPVIVNRPKFALVEIISGSAFTGFEIALVGLSLFNLFPSPSIYMGLSGAIAGLLIFGQYRRFIEKIDLVIIAGITLALVLFLPALRGSFLPIPIIIIAVLSGLGAISISILFLLIYRLLSFWLGRSK